jgi:hypothetical protein
MLKFLVFGVGIAISGVQMAAIRLITPYFGSSLVTWAGAIGLVMLYLALGYWLGGKLASDKPRATLPYILAAVSGLLIALVPLVASFILDIFVNLGQVTGTISGLVLLLALPSVLLGAINPVAVQLLLKKAEKSGNAVGTVNWLTTIGNLCGLFASVLGLLPTVGVRGTFLILAGVLLAFSAPGLLLRKINLES